MTIGERIKDLRKKRDLTQEKLADFLGVSYQAVSKWECNLTSPDLGLIGPLTKLLGVSADELLGLTDGEVDERRAYFDAALDRWHDDELDVYAANAEAAVREFPGEMKYLTWYADCIQMLSVSEPDDGKRHEMDERCLKICDTVLENTDDSKLKSKVLMNAVFSLLDLGRREEARKYAEQFQDEEDRKKFIGLTLTGEERILHDQRQLLHTMWDLLLQLKDTPEEKRIAACDAAETIARLLIPDGDYLAVYDLLFIIRVYRAIQAAKENRFDEALADLRQAKEYGLRYDEIFIDNPGTYRYTAPLFDRIEVKTHEHQHLGGFRRAEEGLRQWLDGWYFDPIRETEDFRALLGE